PGFSFAQSYIEIGTGTTYGTPPSSYAPWGNYWKNVKSQTLYLASELGTPTGKIFTQLAWNFERIANTPDNYLNNVSVKIKETTATSLTPGTYADMTGAEEVFFAAFLIPATATGWRIFDIDDYIWTGTNNLIIEVVWGDNGYWTATYFRTYKTLDVSNRQIVGYSDALTPPNYSGISMYFDNMRWYWEPLISDSELSPQVLSSTGAFYTTANTTLSMTIGESIIDTYIVQDNVLNAGFQQVETFVPLVKFWNGSSDDNWNNSANWTVAGVPVSIDNVNIPSSATRMPIVRVNGLSCRKIDLETGTSLKIGSGIVLRVCGK
ncbi:MAG: hypothetical protein MUC31_07415, partial [Bacteroidales bacterium]|nr:hypothetical protein [Bacteroidales bacterium]